MGISCFIRRLPWLKGRGTRVWLESNKTVNYIFIFLGSGTVWQKTNKRKNLYAELYWRILSSVERSARTITILSHNGNNSFCYSKERWENLKLRLIGYWVADSRFRYRSSDSTPLFGNFHYLTLFLSFWLSFRTSALIVIFFLLSKPLTQVFYVSWEKGEMINTVRVT